jgi:hypothetical protein
MSASGATRHHKYPSLCAVESVLENLSKMVPSVYVHWLI